MEWGLLGAWAPYLLAAALMLGLAGWLAWLDARDLAHRIFIALLATRATTMVLHALRSVASTPTEEAYFLHLIPYFQLAVPILAIAFVALYPRPARWARRGIGWALLALILVVETAYLLRHDLVYTLAVATASTPPMLRAGSHVALADVGPFFALTIQPLAFGVVALVLALAWRHRASPERPWLSGFLVYAGFVLQALFDGALQLAGAVRLLDSGAVFPWLPWGWMLALLPSVSLVPALFSLALVAARARRMPPSSPRGHAIRLMAAAPFPILSALLLALLGPFFVNGPVAQVVLGLWRIALPALVTYALVRHQLFDIDVKVKLALRASTIAFLFLAVFFTVSELAANLIQETVGTALGIAAAVGMAFALRPVERFAETFAHRLMPGTRPVEQMRATERETFYREQVELAMQDGRLGDKERAMLQRLRAHLGLSPEEVARAEGGAMAGGASTPG